MQHCVGLDVSLKQTAVCVVDAAGKIRREGMVASEPKAIADFVAASAPQVVRIGFESGATSTWLWSSQGQPETKRAPLGCDCLPVSCGSADALQPISAISRRGQMQQTVATCPPASRPRMAPSRRDPRSGRAPTP